MVRFAPAARSLTTSNVHLSPIICNAPAMGQPSILRRRTKSPLFHHSDFSCGRIVTSIFNWSTIFIEQFESHRMFSVQPSSQPDGLPFIDELRFVVINDVTHAEFAAVTAQFRV